jgi:hypothetical protein
LQVQRTARASEVIDPQPSPADESATLARPVVPAPAAPAPAAAPLVIVAADDALACVDELCLPIEAIR